MGKRKSPNKAPDREKKWDKIFNALVKLSQNLQNDRQFLEDRIKSLHGFIYKMKMEQKVESLKVELMLGLKDREAFVYKHRYEHADNELADFREWLDCLSQKCSEPKDSLDDVSSKGEGSRNKALQNEVRKLKSELEKCKLEKNSEITALLAEKNFVWNQYKKMEGDLGNQLRKKCDEVQHANEKVQVLVNRVEELQISNEKLRTDFTKKEFESVQKSEEIFRLSKEIELLKSRSGSATPLLQPCRTESSKRGGKNSTSATPLLRPCRTESSKRGGKNSTTIRRVIAVKKESDRSQTVEKMSRTKRSAHKSTGGKAPQKQFMTKEISGSKKKLVDDTPRLFSASFKVPKLKCSSSPRTA